MRFSFIIISNDDSSIQETLGRMENFPNYFCAGSFKDTPCVTDQIIKLKPHLVFISIDDQTNKNTFSLKDIAELFQYAQTIPYFIAIGKTQDKVLEAIQSGVSDYVIGQPTLNQLGISLFKFEKRMPLENINSICIKSYSDYQFVSLHDIIYLKADNNTTDIKLYNGKTVNAYKTLKHFETCLPFYFLRIHKSYIVNIHHVSRIHFSKSKCYINYDEILPFSNNYRNNIDAIVRKTNM